MSSLNFESQISKIFKLNKGKYFFIDQEAILLLILQKENELLSSSKQVVLEKKQNKKNKIKLKNIQDRLESNEFRKKDILKTNVHF